MKLQALAIGSRRRQWVRRYWGLSFLIDDGVLFDTFASFKVLSKKMDEAQVSAAQITKLVISHDHWDHTGGLEGFSARRGEGVEIYLPFSASSTLKNKACNYGAVVFDGVSRPTEIAPNLFLMPTMEGRFDGKIIREQAVVARTARGFILIAGCAHPGIVEMVREAKQLLKEPISGVIGGFHLMDSAKEEIAGCIHDLKGEGVTFVAPTHCTGAKAEKMFHDAFGADFYEVKEGATLIFS
ncbi:MAG: MBL fold metallo-hydrolase [Bdellovibrionales bacterium]